MQRQYFPIALSHIITCFKPGQVLDPVFCGAVKFLLLVRWKEQEDKAQSV